MKNKGAIYKGFDSMMNSKWIGMVGLMAFLGTYLPAHASGDPKAGRAAAAVCLACHGPQGVSMNPLWPNLAGQKEEYLVKQLKDFRSDERKNPVMSPLAKPLSDSEIDNLAAFFASLPAGPAGPAETSGQSSAPAAQTPAAP